ncbi:MAG: pirin family protein [Bacteriovoracaceae bacterium]|nr:pirin family protein [Bacteriovoracaceae bacterium]
MTYLRKAKDRGNLDFGWLKTSHTFSFGEYYEPKHHHYGNLRVINEDFIQGGMGFGTHPHRDMEIVTYVIKGMLKHKDSMGNQGEIKAGEFQRMSAGTGITHSEFNGMAKEQTHLFQIWIMPSELNLTPSYDQISVDQSLKENKLCLVASHNTNDKSPMGLNARAKIYISALETNQSLKHKGEYPRTYVQVVRGNVSVNGETLSDSDGLGLETNQLDIVAQSDCEFILFELNA